MFGDVRENFILFWLEEQTQPRSQGLSSSRPLERVREKRKRYFGEANFTRLKGADYNLYLFAD
jgi:hypothetical protein